MGSYSSLSINGIELFAIKNTISNIYLKLFSPLEYMKIEEKTNEEEREKFILRTSVKKAKTRLEILGCNIERLKLYFVNGLEYQKSYHSESHYEDDKAFYYYSNLTFENYSDALRLILEINNLNVYDEKIIEGYQYILENPVSKVIIRKLSTGYYLCPFFYDEIYENEEHLIDGLLDIYMCLVNSNENFIVEYDLTDVIYGGWIDEKAAINFYDDFMDTTIILAEGKTDINVLERSLEILFPEFKHLFTFFDFHNYRADGGTSYLAKLLKSFSAARINNRIIAIFDNDTAAEVEMLSLSAIPILNNIKVMKLPDLGFCNFYPTIGPAGNNYLNINGMAVSIELFFGDDIIKKNNEFYPIQWRNYVERLGKFHGSITNKSEIIASMEEKFQKPDLKSQDWSKLVFLWESIFNLNS